jgi:Outer membrane protein beta-barrel domain
MRRLLIAVIALAALPTLAQDEARFEVGTQVAAIDLRSSIYEKPLGIGGRFGYNATKWLTMEAEINYFPQNPSGNFGQSVAFFGRKIGHRFYGVPGLGNTGVFFKALPGFIHFGGQFYQLRNAGNRTKPAFDIGLVWEHYFKTYGVFRIDVSDVIIPFGNAAIDIGFVDLAHPRTTHNFYITTGLGVRF